MGEGFLVYPSLLIYLSISVISGQGEGWRINEWCRGTASIEVLNPDEMKSSYILHFCDLYYWKINNLLNVGDAFSPTLFLHWVIMLCIRYIMAISVGCRRILISLGLSSVQSFYTNVQSLWTLVQNLCTPVHILWMIFSTGCCRSLLRHSGPFNLSGVEV